jgi:CRP-like cAMP-binding protein
MQSRIRKREKVEILSRLALFESCTQRELGQIATISVDAHRPAGTILTREGQAGALLFVIVDGKAKITRDGKRLTELGPGDVVGELSLIDGRVRSATVQATTDVYVLQIASDEFRRLMDRNPRLVRNLLRALSVRIRGMDERWPAEL